MAPADHAPGEALIALSGLTKIYSPTPRWMRMLARSGIREPVRALDCVDLTVRAGQICAVVGPNGAGKTTLFRIIVGLTTPTSGRGSVMGLDIEHQPEEIRQVLGWMPAEDRSLLMRATSKENLYLHGRLQGMHRRELAVRIPQMLELVGITQKRDAIVATLSSGMKARLQLARALLPGPRVLLLDEPTGAIDPVAAHSLLTIITDLVREHRLAALISSHRLEEIEALQSHAVLLDQGRIRFAGDLDDLRREWERPLVELVFDSGSGAMQGAASLVTVGVETTLDGTAVRCRLPADAALGDVLARYLGPLVGNLRRIREIPLPMRDLIARVYTREPSSVGSLR